MLYPQEQARVGLRVWLMPRCIRPVACRQDFLFNWRHKKTITSVGMRKAAGAQWGELSGGSGARRLKSGLCHMGQVTLGKSLPCGSLSCHLAMMSRLDHSWLPPSLMRKAPAPNFPREPTKSRFPGPVQLPDPESPGEEARESLCPDGDEAGPTSRGSQMPARGVAHRKY